MVIGLVRDSQTIAEECAVGIYTLTVECKSPNPYGHRPTLRSTGLRSHSRQ